MYVRNGTEPPAPRSRWASQAGTAGETGDGEVTRRRGDSVRMLTDG